MLKRLSSFFIILIIILDFAYAATAPGNYWTFNYSGNVQTYTVPADGWYQLQVWGAQGGGDYRYNNSGGKGGYATGYKKLAAGSKLYVVVGQQGAKMGTQQRGNSVIPYGGYNGGGRGGRATGTSVGFYSGGGGGGATHIATTNRGVLSNYSYSYQSEVLIVAGGGGGAAATLPAGSGGGASGGNGKNAYGGTNASGGSGYKSGSRGKGGDGKDHLSTGGGGGGGGWYGGGSSNYTYNGGTNNQSGGGGAGGSGYTGGVTSWNGTLPSMQSGTRTGNGQAIITLKQMKLANPTFSNKTYNGQNQSGVTCPTGSKADSTTGCTAKNVGTYTCRCIANSGYYFENAGTTMGYADVKWSILTSKTAVASSQNKTYNGTQQSGITGNGISITGGTSTATDVGSYTAYVTPSSGYSWKDNGGTEQRRFDWSISKANSSITSDPTDKSLVYNGSSQPLINPGAASGGEMQYKLNNNEYTNNIPSAINAGKYTIYYKVIGDKNHNDSAEKSLEVIINKANVTIPTLSDNSKIYNRNSQSPTVNNRNANIIGQSGTDSAINAGSYTINWSLIDTDNYQWTDGTISSKSETWTISKANNASAYKTSDKVYTGSVLSGVDGNGVDWTGTPTATEPGTYKAIATPDLNHTWSDGTTVSKEFTWSIFQSWTKYKVRCITDSNGKPVQPNDTISNNGKYKFQEIVFEVKTSDTEPHTFCVGNSLTSEQNILHNNYTSGVYYWENNSWVKK